MKEFVISEVRAETAVLVGLVTKAQDERKTCLLYTSPSPRDS